MVLILIWACVDFTCDIFITFTNKGIFFVSFQNALSFSKGDKYFCGCAFCYAGMEFLGYIDISLKDIEIISSIAVIGNSDCRKSTDKCSRTSRISKSTPSVEDVP